MCCHDADAVYPCQQILCPSTSPEIWIYSLKAWLAGFCRRMWVQHHKDHEMLWAPRSCADHLFLDRSGPVCALTGQCFWGFQTHEQGTFCRKVSPHKNPAQCVCLYAGTGIQIALCRTVQSPFQNACWPARPPNRAMRDVPQAQLHSCVMCIRFPRVLPAFWCLLGKSLIQTCAALDL